jgi:chromate transporter
MAVVTFELGRAAIVDVPTIILGLAATGLLLRWKIDPTWLLLGGAILGIAIAYAR